MCPCKLCKKIRTLKQSRLELCLFFSPSANAYCEGWQHVNPRRMLLWEFIFHTYFQSGGFCRQFFEALAFFRN